MKLHSLFLVLGFLCFFVGFSHADNFKLYTVKRGDSLSAIAYHFHISESSIKNINKNVNWLRIMQGQKIFVPVDANANPKPGTIGNGYYVVKRGDTLGAIATMLGLTLKKLISLNPSVSTIIKPGEIMRIPKEISKKIKIARDNGIFISPRYLNFCRVYKVQSGDSLWSIAHKFGIGIDIVKMLNNLSSNLLRVGEVLFVPNKNLAQTKKMEIALSILHSERDAIVSFAKRFLGVPYVWGGISLTQGVDCSGFVQQIYRRFGIYLPRTAQEQYYSPIGASVKLSQLQPGDILFFHTMSYTYVTHVAMYIGHGKIIEALNPRTGVTIANLNNRYYMKRFIGAKQILSIRRLARYGYFRNRSG